jgi:hypothetical protein
MLRKRLLMTGEHVGARSPSPARKAGSEPPGFERVAGAFRRSGRIFIAMAILTLACAGGLVAAPFLGVGGASGERVFFAAAGVALVLALLPLTMGLRRIRRTGFLAALRHRWVRLGRAGDPDDQIATLRRAYAGLVGNDIHTRMSSAP